MDQELALEKTIDPDQVTLPAELIKTEVDESGDKTARSDLPAGARTTVLPRLVRRDGSDKPELTRLEASRYEPVQPLGEGALGEVVLVRDNDIRRHVAIKKLKQHYRPAQVQRFVEEIQLVGSLDHPNIVPVHDVGIDPDGKYYFVMKYVDGHTLEDVINKLKSGDSEALDVWTPEHRTRVFLEVLRAIRCAHEAGIVHRDLKPANIMVGKFGEVMVMDWGLAKRLDEEQRDLDTDGSIPVGGSDLTATARFETQNGTLLGTPAYMSPEQARGDNDALDERSDIYSLTVLFHEFLTLSHYLHDRTTLNAMLMAIANDDFTSADVWQDGVRGGIPPELLWFVHKGLKKDPKERFQTVREMEKTLEDILAGRFHVQCPATLMRRGTHGWMRFINRHPALSILTVILVAGMTLFGLTSLVLTLVA